MFSRCSRAAGIAALLAVAAGGCREPADTAVPVDVIGDGAALFEPGIRLAMPGQLVRSATAAGLVALDAQGRVIPALADRWIVTDDGLSYIFRLREGTWANGDPLSGESVRHALRQALAMVRGTTLGVDMAAITDVRAMAGRVVEIRLRYPAPELLQLLAQPELGLLHEGRGGGPMTMQRQNPLALLAPIPPRQLGLPALAEDEPPPRRIALHALPAQAAIGRFGEGEVDIVLGGRFADYAAARAAAGFSRRALRIDPVQGLFGLAVTAAGGPLADPALREALAMAIDRDALGAALDITGWTPTSRLVPAGQLPGTAAAARWADLSAAERRDRAAAQTARWRAQHGAPPLVRIALPEGPGADVLFGRLAADLAAAGFAPLRAAPGAPADARLVDAVARYKRPEWFLNQLSCAVVRGPCEPAADAAVAAAQVLPDPVQRAGLLAHAENRLLAANTFIPLGSPVRWSLVRDRVTGFAPNATGLHPLAPLAARGR